MSFVYERGYTQEMALDSVGEGWHDLVMEAFIFKPEGAKIVQVKEKFAGLRIYASVAEGEGKYFDLLHDLEGRSFHICEECGRPGKIRSTGWIKTLCWRHLLERLWYNKYARRNFFRGRWAAIRRFVLDHHKGVLPR